MAIFGMAFFPICRGSWMIYGRRDLWAVRSLDRTLKS
jgi:hypothetical protein